MQIENLTSSTTIALKKDSILFERKLETATEGLTREYHNQFNNLSKEDALTLMDYIISLKTEVNPSDNYRKSVCKGGCREINSGRFESFRQCY
jgi:hypothetical protein